jgi:hypothetical protein
MIRKGRFVLWGTMIVAALAACGSDDATTTAPSAEPATSTSASAEPEASASAEPEPSASAEPEPSASAAPESSAPPSGKGATTANKPPAPKGSSSASASTDPKKKYKCGNKGQKACPMQGWMKGVMARAMAGGNGDKIAKALNTIAAKPVAGYSQWAAIAAAGAAKAKAGNIDGAKASCKKCHDLYNKKYIASRRDQPW